MIEHSAIETFPSAIHRLIVQISLDSIQKGLILIETLIALLSLVLLEVILGIDNLIFISILADKLPAAQRNKLRWWGIGLAMILRLVLLTGISWILKLDSTLMTIMNVDISGKGIILIVGGVFLVIQSTKEIYRKAEAASEQSSVTTVPPVFKRLLGEIIALDLVFSIDSIITAVGMVNDVRIMVLAVMISVAIMAFASRPISEFISRHPSFKILALCFLMMIGCSLIAEGIHVEIPKGYIYFSMFFAFSVDVLQLLTEKRRASRLN